MIATGAAVAAAGMTPGALSELVTLPRAKRCRHANCLPRLPLAADLEICSRPRRSRSVQSSRYEFGFLPAALAGAATKAWQPLKAVRVTFTPVRTLRTAGVRI